MKKFNSILSDKQVWTDTERKVKRNKLKICGETIEFRNTFRIETIEVLTQLLKMRKSSCLVFKKKEKTILNNALLKIQREKFNYKLLDFNFSMHKEQGKNKVIVVRY
jgi:hypothetical protein